MCLAFLHRWNKFKINLENSIKSVIIGVILLAHVFSMNLVRYSLITFCSVLKENFPHS